MFYKKKKEKEKKKHFETKSQVLSFDFDLFYLLDETCFEEVTPFKVNQVYTKHCNDQER